MTPPPQSAALARALDRLHAAVVAFQAGYFGPRGRFWQGIRLPTHDTPDLSLRPTDQSEDWGWNSAFNFPKIPGSAFRVDVYEGPLGHGFVTTAEIADEPGVWRKAMAEGPEVREFDWTFFPPDDSE